MRRRPKPERLIDHTLLQPGATRAEIEQLCAEALEHDFCTVCVYPVHVEQCVRLLAGSNTSVCTVTGFPHGAGLPQTKAFETAHAVQLGAQEIDMVLPIGALREGNETTVAADIRAVRAACPGLVLKVIIEAACLDNAQKRVACRLAMAEGADFVKTSTGFGPGGATVEDVKLIRKTVGPEFGVKAAGGIRDHETFWAMVRAGANRIGTSSAIAILREMKDGKIGS